MAVYEYKALNSKGKEVGGTIEAESRLSAGQVLKRMDLYPFTITETTEETIEGKRRDISLSLLFERITKADISVFTTVEI